MSASRIAFVLGLIGALGVAGGASACPSGLRPAATAELFFGRDIGDAPGVSDEDWRGFVDTEISPRFPSGLSVNDVYGQWRAPDGKFVREPSKAVLLVLAGTRGEARRLQAVREAYRAQFHQQSVLLVEQRACVSF
jgi:hypothetical protein